MNKKEARNKLNKELDLVSAIQLGCALGELSKEIDFNELIDFMNGETNTCKSFDRLKLLFDDFGYLVVKQAIIICDKTPKREELSV